MWLAMLKSQKFGKPCSKYLKPTSIFLFVLCLLSYQYINCIMMVTIVIGLLMIKDYWLLIKPQLEEYLRVLKGSRPSGYIKGIYKGRGSVAKLLSLFYGGQNALRANCWNIWVCVPVCVCAHVCSCTCVLVCLCTCVTVDGLGKIPCL